MYIQTDSHMHTHKKARHVAEYVPGLETQNVVPQCGTITWLLLKVILEPWEPVFTIVN